MKKRKYTIKEKVWIYPGDAAWYFVTVPKKEAREIKKSFGDVSRGFGSLPVEVALGKTKWKTSIFPDKKSETYLLPLKAAVRKKEGVFESDTVTFSIKILP